MIVVDTNVVAYLLIPGELTEAAVALLRRDPDWSAPRLWRSELRSVLALYLRKGEIELGGALDLLERAEQVLGRHEYTPSDRSVMTLVDSSGCSAYDCEFVALATDLEVLLVTADAQVVRDFPKVAVDLRSFAPTRG